MFRNDTPMPTVARITSLRSRHLLSVFAVATLIVAGSSSALAQDYSTFRTVLGASGTLSPDASTISFPLFRQSLDLTIATDLTHTLPAASEGVANGYVAIKQTSTSGAKTFFFTGAFPALASELPSLEKALVAGKLPIVSIVSGVTGLSQAITTVHVQGTLTESPAKLSAAFEAALLTIGNPQANVSVVEVNDKGMAQIESVLPTGFTSLLSTGEVTVLDGTTLLFSFPRADAVPLTISDVVATPSLGVLQSVFVSGSGFSVVTVELALIPKEVQKVTAALIAAGFTVSSQAGYFIDESKRITFVHATATSTSAPNFDAQMDELGKAIQLTK